MFATILWMFRGGSAGPGGTGLIPDEGLLALFAIAGFGLGAVLSGFVALGALLRGRLARRGPRPPGPPRPPRGAP